jgi:Fe-S-cluster-containing dehydrogenase component
MSLSVARKAKAAVQKVFVSTSAPKGYDPYQHKWLMCFDVDKCIGCGLCVDACKKENHVPEAPHFFRTWIERYHHQAPPAGETAAK